MKFSSRYMWLTWWRGANAQADVQALISSFHVDFAAPGIKLYFAEMARLNFFCHDYTALHFNMAQPKQNDLLAAGRQCISMISACYYGATKYFDAASRENNGGALIMIEGMAIL